jgi:hypothetical protein
VMLGAKSASCQSRKCLGRRGMSVLPQTADVGTRTAQVPSCQEATLKTVKKGDQSPPAGATDNC